MNDNYNMNDDIKKFIPGFAMGSTRAIISHPFEMLKLKTQMNITSNFYQGLFKGIHLSVGSNALERGIQFYWFEKFKKKYDNVIISSFLASLISTSISLPYNVILLRKTVLEIKSNINYNIIFKSGTLEYTRNMLGSTIFLYSYDNLKKNNFPIYACGTMTSVIVWGVTYPIDNIKNQIIANKKINLKNIYRGVQYPIIRSIPSSTVGFYVYEYLNDSLNK
jgi:hypothetical protein